MALSENQRLALLRTLAPYASAIESLRLQAETLYTREQTILQRHASYGATDSVENVESSLRSVRELIRNNVTELVSQCRRVLSDRDLVVANLPIPPDSGFDAIVAALLHPDNDALYQIDNTFKSTATGDDEDISTKFGVDTNAPMSASNPRNVSTRDGMRIILLALTDGVTAPSNTVSARSANLGQPSQAMKFPGETIVFELTDDWQSGGRLPGQEGFRIFSRNTGTLFNGAPPSSGSRTNVSTAHALGEALVPSSLLTPPFTVTDIPDGWTVDSGTAGTHFSEDAINTFRSASSLAIASNATFRLSKTIPSAALTRGRYYALYWWERAGSGADDVPKPYIGDLDVPSDQGLGTEIFTREYPTSGAVSEQPYTSTAWRLRWRIYYAREIQPATAYTIVLESAGTNDAGNITSVGLAPIDYYGGVGFLIVPGKTDPLAGAQFTITTSSTVEEYVTYVDDDPEEDEVLHYLHGRWSRFFAEALGIQLPTIQDAEENDNPPFDQVLGAPALPDVEDLDDVPVLP